MNNVNEKYVGGTNKLKSEFKDYIKRIEVDGSRVADFAMSLNAAFMIMKPLDDDKDVSIDPDNPKAKGLIHFYQNEAKEWKFVTQEQYEAQKDSLPNVCFATRHPMKSFLERVKRMRANEAIDGDLNDKSLPDLNQLMPQMQFADGEWDNAYLTTNNGDKFAANSPLYYSFSTINEGEQKIFATEAEAKSGDQVWDLNPLIFFRIKKPTNSLDKLPQIDLTRHFTQAKTSSQVSFTIQVENFNEEAIKAIEIEDPGTKETFSSVLKFSEAQDRELHKILES